MTERHARVLVEAIETVEPELRGQVLPAAIESAEAEPVGAFRHRLRALIETVRSTTLAERHQQAVQRRRVVIEPDQDAMAWVMTLMPAVEAQAVFGRATATAKVILARRGRDEDARPDPRRRDRRPPHRG